MAIANSLFYSQFGFGCDWRRCTLVKWLLAELIEHRKLLLLQFPSQSFSIKHSISKAIAVTKMSLNTCKKAENKEKAIYLSRLKFIFNTVLKTFAFDFHWRQYQTISNEMSRISDAFGRFETAIFVDCVEFYHSVEHTNMEGKKKKHIKLLERERRSNGVNKIVVFFQPKMGQILFSERMYSRIG